MTISVRSATVADELVSLDGPQVLLLNTNRGRPAFAVAICRPGMKEPFFACEATDKAAEKYFQGKADLRYVFLQAAHKAYYFFDLAEEKDDTVSFVRATPEEASNPSFWPDVGFFSRSHTSSFRRAITSNLTIQTYKIDGKWGANDFSHFHAKMSDLYALFAVINRLDGQTAATERGFLSEAIRHKLWRGGGSYVGFYDELFEQNEKHQLAPLEVARIRYSSPGNIDLRGNADALAYASDAVSVIEGNSDACKKLYNEVHGALRKAKLLRAPPAKPFPSEAIRKYVLLKTNDLAAAMEIEKADEIYRACGKNTLVFAKLILSIYRRANELYMFQAEGRVQRATTTAVANILSTSAKPDGA